MNSLRIIFHCCNKNFRQKKLLNSKLPPFITLRYQCCSNALSQVIRLNSNSEDADCYKKIIYSDALKRIRKKLVEPPNDDGPIFLKYTQVQEKISESNGEEKPEVIDFPYEIKNTFLEKTQPENILTETFSESVLNLTPSDNEKIKIPDWKSEDIRVNMKNLMRPKDWMRENEDIYDVQGILNFGTCDPNIPVSSTPCGGCGALLHCTDPSVPGFLPKEIFESKTEKQLQAEMCQRCHFLKEFDVALGVKVSPSEYPEIISQIRNKVGLVLLLVDMTDFPCSIWPGIFDIIGDKKHVLVIGNKMDLFIQEKGFDVKHFKQCLVDSLTNMEVDMKRIKMVHLISAKTGFGVEELISKMYKFWGSKGDVYIIGCTNAGKSTLFNALIQSDFCKLKATEIMQRATISAWPGTTLNLLKFPIKKPGGLEHALRVQRLVEQRREEDAVQKINEYSKKVYLEQIPLKGYVTKSFQVKNKNDGTQDVFGNEKDGRPGLDPKDPDLQGRWCYDTPGVVHYDQIINFLTTSELLVAIPKSMLIPRNFHLEPGMSLFIGGLARLDFVFGRNDGWFTVYASKELPITITKVEDADFVYQKFLGSPIFRVPSGGRERLAKWPKLQSKKLKFSGRMRDEADVDIVLSSAGWVSVNVPLAHKFEVEVWTPEGRGIYLREHPLIKCGHLFRGKRIRGTPAFKTVTQEVRGFSVTDQLPFET